MKSALCFLLVITCLACNTQEVEVISVRYDKGLLSDSLILKLVYDKNEYRYTHESEDMHLITFTEESLNLSYMGVSCQLVETRTIQYNEYSHLVHKFFFDDKDVIDEEMHLYFSKDHGLIALKGQFWNGHTLFDNSNTGLIDALTKDTTDFFRASKAY